jgi:hypothetical protein
MEQKWVGVHGAWEYKWQFSRKDGGSRWDRVNERGARTMPFESFTLGVIAIRMPRSIVVHPRGAAAN